MRSRLTAAVAFFAIGAALLAPNMSEAQTDSPRELSGGEPIAKFRGNYVCVQGTTALALEVYSSPSNEKASRVDFEFGATEDNPSVPAGAFEMEGVISLSGGEINLVPVRWISRPAGYLMVGLQGKSTDGGRSFIGRTVGGVGCQTFDVVRVK